MADADATAATDLAALIVSAPDSDVAAPDAARAQKLRAALKRAHDTALARSRAAAASAALLGDARRGAAAPELVLGDAETIWQQLRLRGRDGDRHALAAEHWLREQAAVAEEESDDDASGDDDDEEDDDASDDEDVVAADAAEAPAAPAKKKVSFAPVEEGESSSGEEEEDEWDDDEDENEGAADGGDDVLEDRFFSLAGMEEFVAEDEALIAQGPSPQNSDSDEDSEEEDASDGEWAGSDDEEYGRTARYGDFFEKHEAKRIPKMDARHKEAVDALEANHVIEPDQRPWELRGEVKASDRPRNSLLGLDATWDGHKRDPPPLDADFGLKIEEVIKDRVLESNFDDVVPQDIVEKAYAERKQRHTEEDDDGALGVKSKLGLGEEYEKDYVERQEQGVEEPKLVRDEGLDEKWRKLASRLDALSHFASPLERPALDESIVAARTKASAILLEDATPGAVSTEDGLAPEEVRAKKRGRDELQRSGEETTRDERKAQRLGKKKRRNVKRKKLRADARVVAKVAPGLTNPYEKKRVIERVENPDAQPATKYGRSGKFFAQLEADVRKAVHGDGKPEVKKRAPARAAGAKLG